MRCRTRSSAASTTWPPTPGCPAGGGAPRPARGRRPQLCRPVPLGAGARGLLACAAISRWWPPSTVGGAPLPDQRGLERRGGGHGRTRADHGRCGCLGRGLHPHPGPGQHRRAAPGAERFGPWRCRWWAARPARTCPVRPGRATARPGPGRPPAAQRLVLVDGTVRARP